MFIDWFTVLAQAVNFLVLVALLKRFLYKPILAAIDERERRVAQALAEAQQARTAALAERTAFADKNAELETNRASLLADATEAAKAQRQALLEAARRDGDALRARLRSALSEEEESLAHEVARRARLAAHDIARRALVDLGGARIEERIVAVFVQRLGELSEQERIDLAPAGAAAPLVVRTAFALPDESRTAVEQALARVVGAGRAIRYETAPQLIGGIEVEGNGRRVAWSFAQYLATVDDEVREALAADTGHGRAD